MSVETRQSIEGKVRSTLSDQLGLSSEEIKLESHVMDDLGADSLDVVELVMSLEEEFTIEITDEEAERCFTVEGIVDAIAAKVL